MKIISNQALQKKIGWNPHPNQEKILKSRRDEIVIAAGRGFGKSMLCAYVCLKELLKDKKQILLIAPTYKLNDRVLENLEVWIQRSFPSLMGGFIKRTPQSVMTPWGSKIECGSAESPAGILGKRFDLVVIDEAAKISRKIHDTYIYPTTQITGGRKFYISTPWGRNWFYEIWNRTKGFQFKSIDNPYFKKGDWERARQVLPEAVFQQEMEARFLADAAQVFRGVEDIIYDDCLKDVVRGHIYIMGVDLGRHRDFTVLTVLDTYNNNVVFWERFKDINYVLQKKRIKAASGRYNNARIIIDARSIGDPIGEDLRRDGMMVTDFRILGGKATRKQELIEKLSIYIEQKKLSIPNIRILIDELNAYGYELTEAGRVKYSAPQGLHDDSVISLALAIWGVMGKATHKTAIQKEIEKVSGYVVPESFV